MLGLMLDAQGLAYRGQQGLFVIKMPLHGLFQPGEVKRKFKAVAVNRPQPKISDDRMVGIDVRVTKAVTVIDEWSDHHDGSAANRRRWQISHVLCRVISAL